MLGLGDMPTVGALADEHPARSWLVWGNCHDALSFVGVRELALALKTAAALGHVFPEVSAGRYGLGAAVAQAPKTCLVIPRPGALDDDQSPEALSRHLDNARH